MPFPRCAKQRQASAAHSFCQFYDTVYLSLAQRISFAAHRQGTIRDPTAQCASLAQSAALLALIVRQTFLEMRIYRQWPTAKAPSTN